MIKIVSAFVMSVAMMAIVVSGPVTSLTHVFAMNPGPGLAS